jgi:hypothetical protein
MGSEERENYNFEVGIDLLKVNTVKFYMKKK